MLIRVYQNGRLVKSYEQATSYINAQVGQLLGETVPPEVLALRERACFGGEEEPECDQIKRRPTDSRPYCGACGCGSGDSKLLDGPTSKLARFARLECPKGKEGFFNAGKPWKPFRTE